MLATSAGAACASGNQAPVTGRVPAATRVRASPFDTAAPDMKAARALAGCYSLTVGAWSGEHAPGWYVTTPSRIHLDTARLERHQPGFELVAQTFESGERREIESLRAWSPVGTDSLQVLAWTNSTSSVNLFLRRREADTLQGTARFFWDQIALDPVTKRWLWEQYPTAPAALSGVPCT